jgi:hypothetical protein
MAFEVNIAPEHEVGVVRLSAQVDGTTLLEALNVLYKGDTWVPRFNAVWDLQGVTELSVGPAEAERMLERMEELCHRMGEGRTVVIAPREVGALFFRMLFVRTTCTFRERKIVHDLDGALAWLYEVYPPDAHGLRAYIQGATPRVPSRH